jgi:hypothetical protein
MDRSNNQDRCPRTNLRPYPDEYMARRFLPSERRRTPCRGELEIVFCAVCRGYHVQARKAG